MEGFKHPLRINSLDLKRFAMISLVSHLYEQRDVKEDIKESIEMHLYNEEDTGFFPEIEIRSFITDIVKQNLNAINMPENLMREAQDLVILLGYEVVRWVHYVTVSLDLDVSYIDDICWTSFGTIDDFQSFKQFWQHDAFFSQLHNGRLLYTLACIHADEEFILKSMNEMITESKNFPIQVKILSDNQMINIIGVWIVNYSKGNLHKSLEDIHEREEEEIYQVKDLFQLCIKNSYVKAAKYFLDVLNENEKFNEIMAAAKTCATIGYNYTEDLDTARNKLEQLKNAELLIWLLNKMTTAHKIAFFMDYFDSVLNTLFVWPYQEIILQILNGESLYLFSSQIGEIFVTLTYFPNFMWNVNTFFGFTIFFEIFERILKAATAEMKKHAFINHIAIFDILHGATFYQGATELVRCIKILKLIINDSDLQSYRNEIIKQSESSVNELIQEGDIKLLAVFIKEILNSNNERRKFIKEWKLLNKLLKADDLEMVNYILNCISNCNGEDVDVILHLDLDHKGIQDNFIEKGRNDLADKYTKWYMEEEHKTKRSMKLNSSNS